MNLVEISQELRIPVRSLINNRSKGILKFPTHRDGLRVWAFCNDVADHLDKLREPA